MCNNTVYTALNSDFVPFTMDLTFTSATTSRVCGINIQTRMDSIYENFEVFSVSLSDASANTRIRLGENKMIRITDEQSKSESTCRFLIFMSLFLQEL